LGLYQGGCQVIEELGEWIVHAFDRYDVTVEDRHAEQHLAAKEMKSEDASPLASETETDDTGITFVPKRAAASSSPPSSDGTLIESRSDTPMRGLQEKAGTPRQRGQIISEGELFRRRRLLDAQMFTQKMKDM